MSSDPARLPKATTTGTGDAGVAVVQEIISNPEAPGLGWIFRPLPTADFGIDGHIEVVRPDREGQPRATGRIVSVQIKTGASYFAEEKDDSWLVRIKKSTIAYWRAHSVPVILVVVNPASRIAFWARGDADDLVEFDTAFGVRVPKAQVLDRRAAKALRQLADNVAVAGRRLAVLEGALPWMRQLHNGERLYIGVDEWVNKSSGRMDVSVGTYTEEQVTIGSYAYTDTSFTPLLQLGAIGFGSWREIVTRQFPWASLVPDENVQPDEDEVHENYLSEHGMWDSEDKTYYDFAGEFPGYLESAMNAWRDGYVGEFGSGEVMRYRMEMKLNRLGRAFLRVYDFLENGPEPVPEE